MRTTLKIITVMGCLAAPPGSHAQAPPAVNPACEKLLPAAAVAKLSGDADVTLIPQGTVPAAGGTCNYAVGGKTVMLYVDLDQSRGPESYQRSKRQRAYQETQQDVPGLGDEAFSATPYGQVVVIARKGKTLVTLLAMLDLDPESPRFNQPHLTRDQLIELARRMLAGS